MRVQQCVWSPEAQWDAGPDRIAEPIAADLVLVFGGREMLQGRPDLLEEVRQAYSDAHVVGCSTSGQIADTHVTDDTLIVTAVSFDSARVEVGVIEAPDGPLDHACGAALASQLSAEGLRYVLLLSEGLQVNGSRLVRGVVSGLPEGVTVTGGLAGDGDAFGQTTVLCGTSLAERRAVAVGFYGDDLRIGHGCLGGWDPFGPERVVTRSEDNVLYELDGQSALELYETYLGDYAKDLPASALLFPLSIRSPDGNGSLVRTILSVDHDEKSMTFAGDIPEGARARFMMANFDRVIDGAQGAADQSLDVLGTSTELALLVSCVGRKLVLDQRVEEEVEAVRDALGQTPALCGFYSYGEVSPLLPNQSCELHNQTMTITTFAESM